MNSQCEKSQKLIEQCTQGIQPSDGDAAILRQHLHSCSDCRERAYRLNLGVLLEEAYSGAGPEPDEAFFQRLQRRLVRDVSSEVSERIEDVFFQVGLKLVPALAIVFMVLTTMLAYVTAETPAAAESFEEAVLYEDIPVSKEMIFAALAGKEERYD